MQKRISLKQLSLHGQSTSQKYIAHAAIVLAILFAVIQLLYIGLTNTDNVYLHYTWHMLQGGLYERWLSVNPPLIMLLYTVPVTAIVWLHLSPPMALHAFTLALCTLSLWLVHSSLKNRKNDQYIWVSSCAFVLLVLPAQTMVFADREHYFIILAVPWIVTMLLRERSSALITCIAALGFCMKPYNIIVFFPLLVLAGPAEIPWRQRILSSTLGYMGLVGIIYVLIIGVFFPSYFTTIIPLALTTYSAAGDPLPYRLMVTALYAVIAELVLHTLPPDTSDNAMWRGFMFAAGAVYFLNGGWVYTNYLLYVPVFLLSMKILIRSMQQIQKMRAAFIVSGLIIIGLTLSSVAQMEKQIVSMQRTGHMPMDAPFSTAFIEELRSAAGNHFVLLSSTLWSANIAVIGSTPQSEFAYDDFPWPIAWVYLRPQDARAPGIRREALTQPLIAALENKTNPALIVDESPLQFYFPYHMDLLGFFKEDPIVRDTLSAYIRTQTIDHCTPEREFICKFSIWQKLNAIKR